MTIREYIFGKYNALWMFCMVRRHFINHRDIWRSIRNRLPLPPLKTRRHLTIHHGKWDVILYLYREIYILQVYRRLRDPNPNGMMVDLGANIGLVSLDFAQLHPEIRIHAYEPNPYSRDLLLSNIKENGFSNRIQVFPEAVGSFAGEVKLWTETESVLSSIHESARNSEARQILVPQVTLETVLERTQGHTIDLLKIDTEGAEVEILEHCTESMFQSVRCVMLEYHDATVPRASERCQDDLRRCGFEANLQKNAGKGKTGMIYAYR